MSGRAAAGLAVLAGAALGAAAAWIGAAAHADVPWVVTVPAGLSLGALLAALFWLPSADPVTVPPEVPAAPTEIASFGDLPGLRFTVEQAGRDQDRFETRLRPKLASLVTELLWQRHRVDWRTEPGRTAAMDMLSPELVALLTAPQRSLRVTPKTLTRWLRELEEL
jgi:hypothetical protein